MITKLNSKQVDINCPFGGLQNKNLQSLIEESKAVAHIYWKTDIDCEEDKVCIHGTIEKVILKLINKDGTVFIIKDCYNNKFTTFEIEEGAIKLAPKSISIEFDDREQPTSIKFDI